MKFRNGRLVEYLSVLDSFDAAEQMLGHRGADTAPVESEDSVVAL